MKQIDQFLTFKYAVEHLESHLETHKHFYPFKLSEDEQVIRQFKHLEAEFNEFLENHIDDIEVDEFLRSRRLHNKLDMPRKTYLNLLFHLFNFHLVRCFSQPTTRTLVDIMLMFRDRFGLYFSIDVWLPDYIKSNHDKIFFFQDICSVTCMLKLEPPKLMEEQTFIKSQPSSVSSYLRRNVSTEYLGYFEPSSGCILNSEEIMHRIKEFHISIEELENIHFAVPSVFVVDQNSKADKIDAFRSNVLAILDAVFRYQMDTYRNYRQTTVDLTLGRTLEYPDITIELKRKSDSQLCSIPFQMKVGGVAEHFNSMVKGNINDREFSDIYTFAQLTELVDSQRDFGFISDYDDLIYVKLKDIGDLEPTIDDGMVLRKLRCEICSLSTLETAYSITSILLALIYNVSNSV
ncbi:uncharacterized protein RJT21DRAFT_111618 [Scheffersomyces amazonensis]|uniref:uncharacterized protein n=1 Tax=Scheffersomyces amazonensis TaxID=1078765 RepID=UPI00315C91C7